VCVCDWESVSVKSVCERERDTDFLSKLVKTYLETEKLVKPWAENQIRHTSSGHIIFLSHALKLAHTLTRTHTYPYTDDLSIWVLTEQTFNLFNIIFSTIKEKNSSNFFPIDNLFFPILLCTQFFFHDNWINDSRKAELLSLSLGKFLEDIVFERDTKAIEIKTDVKILLVTRDTGHLAWQGIFNNINI